MSNANDHFRKDIVDPEFLHYLETEDEMVRRGIIPPPPEDETKETTFTNQELTEGIETELHSYEGYLKNLDHAQRAQLQKVLIGRLHQIRNEFAIKNLQKQTGASFLQICFTGRKLGRIISHDLVSTLHEYLVTQEPELFSREKCDTLRKIRELHRRPEPLDKKKTQEELRKENGTTPKQKKKNKKKQQEEE